MGATAIESKDSSVCFPARSTVSFCSPQTCPSSLDRSLPLVGHAKKELGDKLLKLQEDLEQQEEALVDATLARSALPSHL